LTILLVLAAGCATSTPQTRISEHRELYASFPSAVQRKVSAGEVEVGYTEEMVMLALGEPHRRVSRQTETGTDEVWVYVSKEPRVSFGFGFGSYGRRSGSSVGISTTTGGDGAEERMRVVFRDGKVTTVESVTR
jgi:outer membrane protein assembly factor BamE (lipoprotein component of BamABCDE complex)